MSNPEKLNRRLAVMSAALDFFRLRRSNIARRDPVGAKYMRWAGEEAKFCIGTVKDRAALNARIAKTEVDQRRAREAIIAAMTPKQRETRIRAILNEIEFLPYRPLSVDIGKREAALREELAMLMPVPVADDREPTGREAALAVALAQVA